MGKICLGDIQISGVRLYSGPINTSDATVVAQMLPQGAIAYGSDGKVVGTGQHYIKDGEVGIILADDAEKHSGTYYAAFSITLPSGYYDGTTKSFSRNFTCWYFCFRYRRNRKSFRRSHRDRKC